MTGYRAMIYELESYSELESFISRNRIALIAFVSRDSKLWRYLESLLRHFEQRAGYLISFAMIDIEKAKSHLPSEQAEIARKSCLIRLYFDGKCIFEQEGVFGNLESDFQALRHGVKDVLKRRSVKTLF